MTAPIRICLGVSGSVAAYKSAVLARALIKLGFDVHTILTRSAENFVGPATFAGITGNRVHTAQASHSAPGELHVELAAASDAVVIAPATADLLSRLAHGRADDLITAVALCAACPVFCAPAMHPHMWSHAATQRNVSLLGTDPNVTLIGPDSGEVASGDTGFGRMREPEAIASDVAAALSSGDLAGRTLLVSAGPTVEDIDPVRFIGNRSSGKMGYALAARAARRGAQVTLVSGPTQLPTPGGVTRVDVRSALDMQAALHDSLDGADAVVMSAAVGDYRAKEQLAEKLKRSAASLTLELAPNPDVLAGLGKQRTGSRPLLIGFAVETARGSELVDLARGKLERKNVDMVVANHAADSFGHDDNVAVLVTRDTAHPLPKMSKVALADEVLSWIAKKLAQ